MSGAHVEVSGLTISVTGAHGEERPIVEDISFSIPRGEVLALIGESGSGKTTIALALMGHTRFGSRMVGGTVRVGDHVIDQMDEADLAVLRGRKISYIAQSAASAFNPSRTIMAQVTEPLIVHGLATKAEAEAKAIEIFRSLSLPSPETIGMRYPHQVSGGQLQRLMAAMALITDPELVILDEPTTALDVTTQVDVLKVFKAALGACGATAVYVSHDLAVVAQMADSILVLRNGKIVETGRTAKLLAEPGMDYTRTLLAASRPAQCAEPAQQKEQPILVLEHVTAGYGRVRDGEPAIPVLSDITFSLSRGEALGVIGESGSGKSTLARVIAGMLPPAVGSVTFDGQILPPALSERSRGQLRRVQLVFQNADTALNPAHTVGEILARPLAFYHGMSGPDLQVRIAELLDMIRLPGEIAARKSNELSGGQKQRVNLARALAAQPELLLCDEVTSALDTVVGAAILELIDELRRELGIATVFISHDISTVRAFCDRLMVLYAGMAVEQAGRAEFIRGPHHPYTEMLLRSVPAMECGWLERITGVGEPAAAAPQNKGLCRFLPRCPAAINGTCDRLPPPTRQGAGQLWLCHRELGADMIASEDTPA